MKILFITHYFQPEPNFFMGLPFAKELVRRGHSVQVITGFPNYPGGKVYDGYKIKFFQKEIMDGIPVYRFPLYPSHDRSSFKRMVCYSSLSASMALMAPWLIKKADVAYIDQGPATLGFPAMIMKWLRGVPFVYNVQDIWPDSLLSTGMFTKGLAFKLLNGWCNFVYGQAAIITVIAPGMKTCLMERGVPENKIDVLYNWCDDALICRVNRDSKLAAELGFSGKFNVVFAGNMGKAQALDAVIKAAEILQQKLSDIQIVFIGCGVEVDNLKKCVEERKLNNVLFLPRRPVSEIGQILCQADVLLVHLRKDPLFAMTIPSKIQAYLAIGRPILIGVEGDAAELVEKAGAGIKCEPEDPHSIAEGIIKLYHLSPAKREEMGKNGIAFYDKELSFNVAVKKYELVFASVARK